MTTDCPFSLALLTEPHVGHCTSSTVDSSQRGASSSIDPEKEQLVDGTALCVSPRAYAFSKRERDKTCRAASG